MGFSTFLTIDAFANPFFGNVITWPLWLSIYKREVLSGLCSVHVFYFGYFLYKVVFLQIYPILLWSIIFPHLDLMDASSNNFWDLIGNLMVMNFNSSCLGHAWGILFDQGGSGLISAFSVLTTCAAGSFIWESRMRKNYLVNLIKIMSPMTYSLELLFNRILSENPARLIIASHIGLRSGEEYCKKFLIY